MNTASKIHYRTQKSLKTLQLAAEKSLISLGSCVEVAKKKMKLRQTKKEYGVKWRCGKKKWKKREVYSRKGPKFVKRINLGDILEIFSEEITRNWRKCGW